MYPGYEANVASSPDSSSSSFSLHEREKKLRDGPVDQAKANVCTHI